jgi:hypothetical protein
MTDHARPNQKPDAMNRSAALVLVAASLFSACNKEDPRPHITQEDLVVRSVTVKISSNDWEAFGTPGDDTHGYAANARVRLIDETIANHGSVEVHLQRSNGGLLKLPATIEGTNWSFTHHFNGVRIILNRNGEPVKPPQDYITIKVTIIPPTIP